MADSEVPLNPGSGGANVDTSQVTTGQGSVQRQRVSIGDPNQGEQLANVTAAGALQVDPSAAPAGPLPTGAAQDGEDGTLVAPVSDGWGIRGWLSGIYYWVSNFLKTDTQAIAGAPIATTADGTQLVSVAGPTGDAIDTVGNSLSVNVQNKGGVAVPGQPIQQQQSADLVAGSRLEVSFSTSVAQPVAITDCSNYRYVSVQINSPGTGTTITPQGSNDGINWYSTPVQTSLSIAATNASVSLSAAGLYFGPISFRYFRLNITGITSGTCYGVAEFFTVPPTPNVTSVIQLAQAGAQSADAVTAPSTSNIYNWPFVFNGSTWDRQRAIGGGAGGAAPGTGTSGAGVAASGIMGQYTQTGFINTYYSSAYYWPLQVDSMGNLRVVQSGPRVVQLDDIEQIAGNEVVTTAPGVQLVSIAGPTGDPIDTIGDAMLVAPIPNLATVVPSTNHQTIATTGTAVELPGQAATQGVIISALITNVATLYVGAANVTSANGLPLQPGEKITLPVANASLLYINGTSGDGVGFLAL